MRQVTFQYIESLLYYQAENKRLLEDDSLTDRQRKRLKEQVRAVERIYSTCNADVRRFIELKYFDSMSWAKVAKELKISRFALFELRRLFIIKLADLLGLV